MREVSREEFFGAIQEEFFVPIPFVWKFAQISVIGKLREERFFFAKV